MKSLDLVVWSCIFSFGNTNTTPFMLDYKDSKLETNKHGISNL